MQKNNNSGKLIVFEGLDGSGQSTQAALLKDFLVGKGYRVILTKEPTMDSEAGRKIRQILDKKTAADPWQLQELFSQDREKHLERLIVPSLKDGKMVISDRYFFSSFAYGTSSGVNLEKLIGMNSDFLLPDFTVILKVSPKVCMERIGKRGEQQTLFEEEKKLAKVWQVYQILPERFGNVYIIDGEKSIDEVFNEIKSLVRSKLNL